MKNILLLFQRGLMSESLKHRSTFIIWFILLLPVAIVTITFLTVLVDDNSNISDPWRWYILFNFRPYFHLFVFVQILFICHLNYLEHRNNTWKNLYVLPTPHWSMFLPKIAFGYALLFLTTLFFYCLVMISGMMLAYARPDFGFQHTNYWFEALTPTLKFIGASAGMVSIMYWVSYYVKSIVISVVVGFVGYVSAFLLHLWSNRPGYDGFRYSRMHPFNFPGYAFESFGTGNHSLNLEFVYYGIVVGVVVLTIHYFSSLNKKIV